MNDLDTLTRRLAVEGWQPDATVVVGMSGGVDSTVTAALLLRAGFKVVGVTLRLWSEGSRCCSLDDIDDARYAASKLGIPFYVIDREPLFRDAVVLPFIAAYGAGITPNPCTTCNAVVKFAPLIELADQLGAVGVASGHYAHLDQEGRALRQGEDAAKDQSYFLYAIPSEQRPRIRFPLAGLSKSEVRQAARLLHLPVADKAESQDLCFLPDGDLDHFLRAQGAAPQPGPIVDAAGRVVGQHTGIHRYTVGQRKGLDLKATTADAEPQYVLELDPTRNRLVVGPRAHLEKQVVTLRGVIGWVASEAIPETVWLRVRHRGPLQEVQMSAYAGAAAVLTLKKPFGPITPGQAGVVYDEAGRVLFGGVIDGAD
ncbi:MAG: tRNA 2-thiouridine(34) synthase MnmA [Alphaproteobacteria bacterium CG_4_10_14_0_2_um_filter_63_37]|nr:MAG: tRNA 2-thiouridine(34) synthase MnmA [Alphaproteobacteria bacterium CG_4_10_14_0_2_um_filter_63_37]